MISIWMLNSYFEPLVARHDVGAVMGERRFSKRLAGGEVLYRAPAARLD